MRAGLGRLARPFGVVGLRSALPLCGGCPAQAGSRPGGRGTFFVRTKKVPKESRPASTPLAAQGVPCAARSIGWLRNSALRASDSPRHRRCASEPDASALLGVSEGDRKASTIDRILVLVARVRAEGRKPRSAVDYLDSPNLKSAPHRCGYEQGIGVAPSIVLTLGSRRERRVAERDREEGRGLFEHRAQRGRVPQAPGRASNAGKSGAQHLTANGVSGVSRSTAPCRWSGQCVQTLHYFGSPFLGYFFWRSKRSNTPAGGGTPANARLQTNNGHREPKSTLNVRVGLGDPLPTEPWCAIDGAHVCLTRSCMTSHQNHRRTADRGICQCNAIHNRTPPQRRDANIIGGDECSTRS